MNLCDLDEFDQTVWYFIAKPITTNNTKLHHLFKDLLGLLSDERNLKKIGMEPRDFFEPSYISFRII